jgi:hypothetical protein
MSSVVPLGSLEQQADDSYVVVQALPFQKIHQPWLFRFKALDQAGGGLRHFDPLFIRQRDGYGEGSLPAHGQMARVMFPQSRGHRVKPPPPSLRTRPGSYS